MTTLLNNIIEHPYYKDRDSLYLRWYPKHLSPPKGQLTWLAWPVEQRGAYIHVPFCDRLCKFCPFHKVVTNSDQVNAYVDAIKKEIFLYASHTEIARPLAFVYFGGGTPSILSAGQIADILDTLNRHIGITADAEVSLETHPTHASAGYLRSVGSSGITRVSLGIQSFQSSFLKNLGATHLASDSCEAVINAMGEFKRVAVDLLYGIPGQNESHWQATIEDVICNYKVPHISCYALVDDRFPRQKEQKNSEIEMALLAFGIGSLHRYKHYASCASGGFDLCRPNHECKYEYEHWHAPQSEYLGLGPGAFGYFQGCTTVNCLDIKRYSSLINSGKLPLISHVPVDLDEAKHRYFSLGVKTLNVPLRPYEKMFGGRAVDDFAEVLELLSQMGLIDLTEDLLSLTDIGRLFVDACSAAFWSEKERSIAHPEEPELRMLETSLTMGNYSELKTGRETKFMRI